MLSILKVVFFIVVTALCIKYIPGSLQHLKLRVEDFLESALTFYKWRKFHFLMFTYRYRKDFANLKHDLNLFLEYFKTIIEGTAQGIAFQLAKSSQHIMSFISLLMFLNFITMPLAVIFQFFLENCYPVIDGWLDRVLDYPEYFLSDTLEAPIQKEALETLESSIKTVKEEDLTESELEELKKKEAKEKKEKEFRKRLETYNLLTAYLALGIASVMLFQVLKRWRED